MKPSGSATYCLLRCSRWAACDCLSLVDVESDGCKVVTAALVLGGCFTGDGEWFEIGNRGFIVTGYFFLQHSSSLRDNRDRTPWGRSYFALRSGSKVEIFEKGYHAMESLRLGVGEVVEVPGDRKFLFTILATAPLR